MRTKQWRTLLSLSTCFYAWIHHTLLHHNLPCQSHQTSQEEKQPGCELLSSFPSPHGCLHTCRNEGWTYLTFPELAKLWSFQHGWVTSNWVIKLLHCIIILTSLPFSGEDKPNFNLLLIESLSRDWLHPYTVRQLFFLLLPFPLSISCTLCWWKETSLFIREKSAWSRSGLLTYSLGCYHRADLSSQQKNCWGLQFGSLLQGICCSFLCWGTWQFPLEDVRILKIFEQLWKKVKYIMQVDCADFNYRFPKKSIETLIKLLITFKEVNKWSIRWTAASLLLSFSFFFFWASSTVIATADVLSQVS